MSLSERHVALPKSFSGGHDFDQWIQKFEICATANGWDRVTQAKKIIGRQSAHDINFWKC